MRKKGDRIINGKVVHAEEVATTAMETVDAASVNGSSFTSTGLDLSSALRDEEFNSGEHTIVLKIKGTGAPEVTMTGLWDGRLLSAALRGVHKQYKEIRRHAAVWAMKQSQKKYQLQKVA